MFVLGQKWLYSSKVFVFGQKWLYSGKSACIWAKLWYSGKIGCIPARWFIRAKWLYKGKSGCNLAEVVFGQTWLHSAKIVVFWQIFREKVAVLWKKGLYSFKVVEIVQKWLYSGKSCCDLAKIFVFG